MTGQDASEEGERTLQFLLHLSLLFTLNHPVTLSTLSTFYISCLLKVGIASIFIILGTWILLSASLLMSTVFWLLFTHGLLLRCTDCLPSALHWDGDREGGRRRTENWVWGGSCACMKAISRQNHQGKNSVR